VIPAPLRAHDHPDDLRIDHPDHAIDPDVPNRVHVEWGNHACYLLTAAGPVKRSIVCSGRPRRRLRVRAVCADGAVGVRTTG
jgi:hypothetical protein